MYFLFYEKKQEIAFKIEFPTVTCQLGQYRKACEQIFLFQEVLISAREAIRVYTSYADTKLFGILAAIFLHVLQFLCNPTSTALLPPFIFICLQMCP